MEKAVKEITIMLLICLIAMLILAVVLYKYVPSRKVVPEVTTYAADEQTQDLLSDPIDQTGTASDVILTYEVTEKDLGGYKGTQDLYQERQTHLLQVEAKKQKKIQVIL